MVVIAGDGAFFMHGIKVHSALHCGLAVTFMLLNNNATPCACPREQLNYDALFS